MYGDELSSEQAYYENVQVPTLEKIAADNKVVSPDVAPGQSGETAGLPVFQEQP